MFGDWELNLPFFLLDFTNHNIITFTLQEKYLKSDNFIFRIAYV